ncbi:MAG: TraY domain-containing protein [Rhodobacteraceae bacterium]|nr:TraY domain-containing protein [Paracoccaceae bacterium]
MQQTIVNLSDETHSCLEALSARTARSAALHIRQAIEDHLEAIEDLRNAEAALIAHRQSGGRTLSLDELDAVLDLEN